MAEVRYRDYRKYQQQRDATNTAVMGLLAASHMSSATLHMNRGSSHTLSELYPTVPYIHRFNLRADIAQQVLDDADATVALLAIPQIIAIQEDLLKGMLRMIATNSPGASRSLYNDAKSATVHERLERHSRVSVDPDALEIFHLLRVARNTHIHAGGRADVTLVDRRASLSHSAEAAWSRITRAPAPTYSMGREFRFRYADLIAMLAVAKRLARDANTALQACVPRQVWAAMVLADWRQETSKHNLSAAQVESKVMGFARRFYSPLAITREEAAFAISQQ